MPSSLFDEDAGVKARRDDMKVYRYRVAGDHLEIRGVAYRKGDVVLLSGFAAATEPRPLGGLELDDPEPVDQTEDPATWEAQRASSVHVHLNESLAVHAHPRRAWADYAGTRGNARVEMGFDCGPWCINASLTLDDATRIHAELAGAIEDMRRRMYEGGDDGDLHIHQVGGSF